MTQPTPFTVLSSTQVREVNTTRWPKTPQQFHEEYQEAESKLQTFEIHPESRKIKPGEKVYKYWYEWVVADEGSAEALNWMCNRIPNKYTKWRPGSQVLGIKEQYEGKTVVKIIE